jgi:hypothetical protein
MVSRRHATVRATSDGETWLEDQASFNGTLLNGRRIQRERVASGDIIRLGEDGPEMQLTLGDAASRTTGGLGTSTDQMGSVSQTDGAGISPPTQFTGGPKPQAPPTQYGASRTTAPDTQYGGGAGRGSPPPTQYGGAQQAPPTAYAQRPGGFATTSHTPAPTNMPSTAAGGLEAPAVGVSGETPRPTYNELSTGDEVMLENKIGMLRNLTVVVMILCVALIGVVIYQSQEIKKTQDTLNAMQRQATDAVGQFMPQLNTRLNRFDNRLDEFQTKMDQMDANMKKAEDRFVARMDIEMPKIMDRYVQMKANELQRGANVQVKAR